MTNTETVLLALRGCGPASVSRLSKITGIERQQVYNLLYRLRQQNQVVRTNRAAYDVTKRGQRVTKELGRQMTLEMK